MISALTLSFKRTLASTVVATLVFLPIAADRGMAQAASRPGLVAPATGDKAPSEELGRGATVALPPTSPEFEARIKAIPLIPNEDLIDPRAFDVDQAAFDRVFSHHRLPVDNLRIHFVMGGKGPPVLLLHGWPTSWYEWWRVMPLLAANYTLVVPDLPGIGRSEGSPTTERKREIAEVMLRLMSQLGFERFSVVGHDWGTPTGYAMAYLAPERIEKLLISESTIPGLDVPGIASWERFNSMWWHHLFHMQAGTPELLVTGRERQYLDSKYRAWVFNYEKAFTPDYLDAFVTAYTQPGSLTAGFGLYRALDDDAADNREFLKAKGKLKLPVMVVTGRYQVNDGLQRQIIPVVDDYRGAIIDDCQHFLMIEAPHTFARIVDDFLQGRPVSKAASRQGQP
ncbi:MAG: alpha/beta hydrolase [Xanthobacteraceae bacterium]|nr:alpha/beta hydrolase [Xanthobacteraceae bacterium]